MVLVLLGRGGGAPKSAGCLPYFRKAQFADLRAKRMMMGKQSTSEGDVMSMNEVMTCSER